MCKKGAKAPNLRESCEINKYKPMHSLSELVFFSNEPNEKIYILMLILIPSFLTYSYILNVFYISLFLSFHHAPCVLSVYAKPQSYKVQTYLPIYLMINSDTLAFKHTKRIHDITTVKTRYLPMFKSNKLEHFSNLNTPYPIS